MQKSLGSGSLPSNTIPNPRADLKAITTWSCVTLAGPLVSPPPSKEPKPTIPYPSRANKQKLHEKDDILALKFVNIFRNLHFELSFTDALLHMPKFALMFKSLLNNKEKLFDLAMTPVNENCFVVILKKLPKKLGDPEKLSLPELTSTKMILVLADRSTTRPAGIAEDIFVKKALIDVYGEELTLRVDDEAITFNVGQTSKYSYNDAESINRIDVIDVACGEYVQEVLGFSNNSKSGSFTPTSDPIISSSSPSFTPFEGSDFILEEIETFLQTPDELSNLDDDYYDRQGDILYLEKFLIEDPSPNLPLVKTEDLKQVDATMTKPSIKEPPNLELKELPSHLEYTFLEGIDKLPVIISKELKDEEKSTLLNVLKSHKRAIAWKTLTLKMDFPDTLKSRLTHKTKKRLPLLALMEHLPTDVCLLVYAMLQACSKVYTNHSALKYLLAKQDAKPKLLQGILLLQEFDVIIRDKKGAENLAADHLSRLENPDQDELEKKEITKTFPFETLGDHRKVQLNELNELHDQAHENSLIYKEKTKNINDSKIKDRVFNVGDRVLLFNSHLKIFLGKLKTCWTGPFTVAHVFPYETIELSQADGPSFKVNGHRLKHYLVGYIPKLVVPDIQTFPMDQ
nr:reverse transcriptase domain-containing protein [Tanacetum cinerariifolium]